MSITRKELLTYLDNLLNSNLIKDYCPNGLQVEGNNVINKVVTGVTASAALIDEAIARGADTILVHHGYFWKGEQQSITGLKQARIKKLLANDINLFAYHLPIDVHQSFGNNIQLAKLLNVTNVESIESVNPVGVLMRGEFSKAVDANELEARLTSALNRKPLVNAVRSKPISSVAWCTGGGQGYIDIAAELGVDAFITGEASEQTIHSSREYNIDFFAAGHHATERYGVKSLGEHLAEKFSLDVEFVDIHNPV
mgnify:CR=1 FL=1